MYVYIYIYMLSQDKAAQCLVLQNMEYIFMSSNTNEIKQSEKDNTLFSSCLPNKAKNCLNIIAV